MIRRNIIAFSISSFKMEFHLTFFLLISILFCESAPPNCGINEALCPILVNGSIVTYPNFKDHRTIDLIRHYGYPAIEHKITTEDGYILTVYRIPYSNFSNPSKNVNERIPVFCMHGLMASSAQWFWQPRHRALVFMLADAGYDVWIGNARGTSYSQEHVKLNVSNLDYWDFSSFDMGKYDIPEVLNFVLNHTSFPSLYYIGHSLGAQQLIVALSLKPELNSKIRTMFALSPAVYTGNTTNPLLRASTTYTAPYPSYITFNRLSEGRRVHPALAKLMGDLAPYCANSAVGCTMCHNYYFGVFGFNPCQCDYSTLPGLLTHLPDTVSAKTYSHSSQAIVTGEFRQYDYGYGINMQKYGSASPPNYDWNNINLPVILYWGDNDNLVVPRDVAKTAKALGNNLKENIKIPVSGWNHLDFIVAKDADIHIYSHIIDIMDNRKYG